MAWKWGDGPIVEGTDIQDIGVFHEFYKRLDKIAAVVGNNTERCCGIFPRSQVVWGTFTVASITATTITPDEMPEKCEPVRLNRSTGTSSPRCATKIRRRLVFRGQLIGATASGTDHSLTVDDQDWWDEFWYPKGDGRDEPGTFTGGSTLGGFDSSKGNSDICCQTIVIRVEGEGFDRTYVFDDDLGYWVNEETTDVIQIVGGNASIQIDLFLGVTAPLVGGCPSLVAGDYDGDVNIESISCPTGTSEPTEESCFWSMSRFLLDGSAFPYDGFVIEINIGGTWHKRVITSASNSTGGISVGWDEPLPASANGKAYRIREAYGYVVNRFAGKTATLIEPDGTTEHQVTLLANDDKSLFWEAADFTVGAGWTYVIDDPTINPAPNDVYEWDGSEWQYVGGSPDVVMRYSTQGLIKGARVGMETLNELYALIDILDHQWKPVTVSSRADDEVEEFNTKTIGFVGHNCGDSSFTGCIDKWPECWPNLVQAIDCGWDGTGGTTCQGSPCGTYSYDGLTESVGLPFAEYAGTATEVGSAMGGLAASRRYAYVSVTGLSTCFPVEIEIWGKAQANGWACPSNAGYPYSSSNGNCGDDHPIHWAFDTNGDGDFGWGEWQKITEFSEVSNDGETAKFRIGDESLSIPAEPPTPCEPEISETNFLGSVETYKGYRMTGAKAVLIWDFSEAA